MHTNPGIVVLSNTIRNYVWLWLVIKINSCDRNKGSDTAVLRFFLSFWDICTGTDYNDAPNYNSHERWKIRLSFEFWPRKQQKNKVAQKLPL